MMLKKSKLKKIIENYLVENEDNLITGNVNSETFKNIDRMQIYNALKSAGVLENDVFEVMPLLDKQLVRGEILSSSENLLKQTSMISYLCDVYEASPGVKAKFVKHWSTYARHIVNPAFPFALITIAAKKPGFSVALYIIMEIAWFIDKDLYYDLVELDKILLDIITLGTFSNVVDKIESLAAANADELILYSTQMYVKENTPIKKSFTRGANKYDFDGTQKSKKYAKSKLREKFFDIISDALTSEVKNTILNILSKDPGEIRKQEMESMKNSGGKTDIKFNVLDRL